MAIWNALCISFKLDFDVGTSKREEFASSDADLTPDRFSLEEDKFSPTFVDGEGVILAP